MADNFTQWFSDQLKERGWTHREMSRRAGISNTWVSDVASGTKEPNWEFCATIAAPFEMSVTEVLLEAGKLTPSDVRRGYVSLGRNRGGVSQKLIAIIELLGEYDQEVLLRVAEGLSGSYARSTNTNMYSEIGTDVVSMNDDVPLETLRELKEHDPETYYAFLEDRLGPNWKQIVEDFVSIKPVLDTLDEVDQVPSTEHPVSTRRQRG